MATDPQSLFNQSACYACFSTPAQMELLAMALMAQWAGNAQGAANLVPGGSNYSVAGIFTLSNGIVPGGFYQWTPHANDSSMNNSVNNCTSTCTIQALSNNLQLVGTNSASVTAVVVRVG